MDTPLWVLLLLLQVLLTLGGLLLFLPEWPWERWRRGEAARVPRKYGYYILAATAVLVVHLVEVQADFWFTQAFAWDLAPDLAAVEGHWTTYPAQWANETLGFLFSILYVVVHPFMMYFPILLFLLSSEERAAKAALLAYPLAYAFSLPFYLLLPATNPAIFFGYATPLYAEFPDASRIYYDAIAPNNSIPAFEVAVALLIANAATFSRNRGFRAVAYAYAALSVFGAWYLGLNWVTGIALAVVLALMVATLTRRILSVERITLSRVRPTPEEALRIQATAEELVKAAGEKAREVGVEGAEPMLVGSVAKDTYLASKVDLDVFILFPPDTPRTTLEKKGTQIGRAVLTDGEAKYAEHPYITGTFRGVHADLVPAYRITSTTERMSAVDRTPFHTRYVLSRMERDQRDQVRLLKQFLGAIGIYGAEAKVRGFSGYLAELLIIKYGSFRGVMEAGRKWFPGQFLVLEALENPPTFPDPLVVIDPVDPRRNVASAVALESLVLFIAACQAYVDHPGLSFFFPRKLIPLKPEELAPQLARRGTDLVLLEIDRPDVLEDHLHDQMRKAAHALGNLLIRNDFTLKGWSYELTPKQARLLLEVTPVELPESVEHAGPPAKEREHADRFRKAWENNPEALGPVTDVGGRLRVLRRREHRRAGALVAARWKGLDLGKHVTKAMEAGFRIVEGPALVKEEYVQLLTRHLNRKRPWEL